MKRITFQTEVTKDCIVIEIRGDYIDGEIIRSEGARPMRLASNRYQAECQSTDFRNVPPDFLALAAVLTFHPVIPEHCELSFSHPVSPRVGEALRRPYILPTCEIPASTSSTFNGDGMVLSYGGGFDSLAAHALFPDAALVHQSPLSNDSTQYEDVVNSLMPKVSENSHVVRDNMREMWTVWGLPLWVSVFVPSLFMSPRYIVSGSELTGTYLEGGKRWHPRYKNRWYEVFSTVGLQVLPTSFASEVLNARLCYAARKNHLAAYCAIVRNQDCGACTKCLRRRLLRSVYEPASVGSLLGGFSRSDKIYEFLKKRPLYYGDVFKYCISRLQDRGWIHDLTSDVTFGDLGFHSRYFGEAFDHFNYPKDIREQVEARMSELGVKPMDEEDIIQMQMFAQQSR